MKNVREVLAEMLWSKWVLERGYAETPWGSLLEDADAIIKALEQGGYVIVEIGPDEKDLLLAKSKIIEQLQERVKQLEKATLRGCDHLQEAASPVGWGDHLG